jgi:hypothetical protein
MGCDLILKYIPPPLFKMFTVFTMLNIIFTGIMPRLLTHISGCKIMQLLHAVLRLGLREPSNISMFAGSEYLYDFYA